MARTVYCDNQCGEEAAFMVSNLKDGSSVALCEPCYSGFIKALADQLAPGPQEGEPQAAETAVTAAGEGEAAPARPRPKRGRRGDEAAEAGLSAPSSPFPDATPIDG